MAGFKFIYGCVTIHVMSGSRERFINMCHHRKICLEHVISGDEYLEAVISARNFRTACEIAKKTGNKIHYSRGLLGSKIALVNLNDDVILSFTNRFNNSYYVLTWDKFHDENYIESEANKAQERKNQRAYSEKHNLFNFIN